MFKESHVRVVESLGVAPVCLISDEDLWNDLVTPTVKGLIGTILRADDPVSTDRISGLFDGDDVSNLNDHQGLYGGRAGFTRCHYLVTFYKTERGAFIIKRDNVKFELFCWFGDVENNAGQLIFKAALRDRRFDGTLRANDSPLLDFPYDDPVAFKPISPELKAVELSIYGFMPDTNVGLLLDDCEFERFFKNPFAFVSRPRVFMKHFRRAWKSGRCPGQHAAPIADVSKLVMSAFSRIAEQAGYDVVELAASHYHVARWAMKEGFHCVEQSHLETLDAFRDAFDRLDHSLNYTLSRSQQSWLCVIQSLPRKYVPTQFRLGKLKFPQDNIGPQCLWMYRALSEKARLLLEQPLPSPETAQSPSPVPPSSDCEERKAG
jgi:hypothetical protein